MAHGRTGPDIVMTVRYAGASEIRSVSEHEKNRTPDGASMIDPARSHLNKILLGPATQQEALEALWALGVKRPAQQAEAPYIQMVLSASPQFFRGPGQGPGQWRQQDLAAWVRETMKWLRKEYGDDLVHASLHLDEDTPHIHVLVVPTYKKAGRKPGRQKRNETLEQFEARKIAAATTLTRAAGRSSCEQWARPFARKLARESYHSAMRDLGLGYGKDFIGSGPASAKGKTTGAWVREQSAEINAKLASFKALATEIQAGTLERGDAGKILAKHPGKLSSGGPEVLRAAEAILPAIEALAIERAKVARESEELRQEREELRQERLRLNGLRTQVEKALKAVSSIAPKLLRIIRDADAAKASRDEAKTSQKEIDAAVLPLRNWSLALKREALPPEEPAEEPDFDGPSF